MKDGQGCAETQFGFSCTQCGECCRHLSEAHNVYLNEADIARIAGFLGMSDSDFKATYLVESQSRKTEAYEFYHFSAVGKCAFLADDNRCSIHSVKPYQCANTPFDFFWTGKNEYACTDGARVPLEHSSERSDRLFLQQSRRRR
jgi:Fe-S-cluster containining protein